MRKHIKKITALILAASFLTSFTMNSADKMLSAGKSIYMSVEAAENNLGEDVQEGVTQDGLTYLYNSEKVVIKGYEGTEAEVTIPETINDLPVTDIAESAFKGNQTIHSVIIEAKITEIPSECFWDSSLEHIVMPTTLKKINGIAFCNSQLKGTVEIPEGTEIIENSFYGTGIEYIILPSTIKTIGIDAFSYCKFLKKIVIPEGVTSINGIVRDCESLESIELPSSLESIEYDSFNNCKSLRSVTIPENVTEINARTFENCHLLSNIYIPPSVNYIANDAFNNCYILTIYGEPGSYAETFADENNIPFSTGEMEIPEVKYETSDNFEYISYKDKLIITSYVGDETEIIIPEYLDNIKVTELVPKLFYNNNTLESITIECDVEEIPSYCFAACTSLKNVTITGDIKHIGQQTFHYCTALEHIILPDSINSMDVGVFSQCESLKSITLPSNLSSIPTQTFYDCPSLESVYLPESATGIGNGAFESCTLLKELEIPESIYYIGQYAFIGCTSLEKVVVLGNSYISDYAFSRCHSLNALYISEKTNNISENAFIDCLLLNLYGNQGSYAEKYAETNNIPFIAAEPENVHSDLVYGIKDNFEYICSGGKAIITDYVNEANNEKVDLVIPEYIDENKVIALAEYMFLSNNNITNVDIQAKVEVIPQDFFAYSSLESVIINEETKVISCAFSYCENLKEVALPDSVINIDMAFNGCTSLEKIYLPENLEIFTRAFQNCTSLTEVNLPENIETVSEGVFYGCTSLKKMIIPENVNRIEMCAFYNCEKLTGVYIPKTVQYIDDTTFENCYFLVISATKGSYAIEYAKTHNIKYIEISENADNEGFEAGVGADVIENLDDSQELPIFSNNGSAIFDSDSVIEIKHRHGNKDISFSYNVVKNSKDEEINDTASDVIENGGKLLDFDLTDSDGNKIEFNSQNNDGTVTITVPYTKPVSANEVWVYYIAPDGTKTDMNGVYDPSAKTITFTTTHFSYYSIESDGDVKITYDKYDVNKDGAVNVSDAVSLQNFLLTKPNDCCESADINNDGFVNVIDLTMLKRKILNI